MINDQHTPVATGTEPSFYVPWYQFSIRIVLGLISACYFFFLPVPLLLLNNYFITFLIIAYILFHIIWWRHFQKKGISIEAIRLANWVDLIGGGMAVVIDPYLTPPTILLILVIVLGNGIQHGLKNFISVSKKAVMVCLIVIPFHFYASNQWPPYDFYFFVIFLLLSVHYAYFLLQRIEQLKIKAEELAQRDELTGLMNRRAFMKSAHYLISLYNRIKLPLVFVFADLDGFKKVNDIKGHAAGDVVLRTFGVIATDTFRKTDIAARYGGDEFVFILTNIPLESAKNVISRLESRFLNWAKIHNINVGVSFGIREVNEEKVGYDEIMMSADAALYEEKKKKKGRAKKAGLIMTVL